MVTREEIIVKLKKIDSILDELLKDAKNKNFSENDCPLNESGFTHADMAQILEGMPALDWVCPFCGKKFDV